MMMPSTTTSAPESSFSAAAAFNPVRRRSLSDPFAAALRPPPNETTYERDRRIADEHRARQISEAIDEQLKLERAEQRRNKVDVKVLLLGQSESGKSTTLKREQSSL
jgi:guanine nucleotide-binding protein alpha-1 subunit